MAYRVYVTDVLRVMNENVAKIAGGSIFSKRYIDIVNPQKEKRDDDRTADEIISDIVSRAGITVVKTDGNESI